MWVPQLSTPKNLVVCIWPGLWGESLLLVVLLRFSWCVASGDVCISCLAHMALSSSRWLSSCLSSGLWPSFGHAGVVVRSGRTFLRRFFRAFICCAEFPSFCETECHSPVWPLLVGGFSRSSEPFFFVGLQVVSGQLAWLGVCSLVGARWR